MYIAALLGGYQFGVHKLKDAEFPTDSVTQQRVWWAQASHITIGVGISPLPPERGRRRVVEYTVAHVAFYMVELQLTPPPSRAKKKN